MPGKFTMGEPVITNDGKAGIIKHCYSWDECNIDWVYGVLLIGHGDNDLTLYFDGQLKSGKVTPKEKRTIDDAVKCVPDGIRKGFKQAWNYCGVMDLYDGEPEMYMAIIAQTIRDDKAKLVGLKKALNIFQMELNKVLNNVV